jgi:hypothetical protein
VATKYSFIYCIHENNEEKRKKVKKNPNSSLSLILKPAKLDFYMILFKPGRT